MDAEGRGQGETLGSLIKLDPPASGELSYSPFIPDYMPGSVRGGGFGVRRVQVCELNSLKIMFGTVSGGRVRGRVRIPLGNLNCPPPTARGQTVRHVRGSTHESDIHGQGTSKPSKSNSAT